MQLLRFHAGLAFAGAALGTGAPLSASDMELGVISYWGASAPAYDVIPSGSIAVINPDNGALVSDQQTMKPSPDLTSYAAIVTSAKARNVATLGYVPTGYFAHGCNVIGQCQKWDRIEAQVQAYFTATPDVAGIFFDETSPAIWDCGAFGGEYRKLREIVHRYRPDALIAFNAGVPDNCVVAAVEKGEIAVLFENSAAEYVVQAENVKWSAVAAREKGVRIWHLVHSIRSQQAVREALATARSNSVDYFYGTSIGGNWQAGENTWGQWSGLKLHNTQRGSAEKPQQ